MRLIDIVSGPWAITPEMLLEIQSIYATHLRGEKIDLTRVEAAIGKPLNNTRQGSEVIDGVAIINIQGSIAKRMNLFSQICGGTSTQLTAADLATALNDPAIKAIVLNIDSPGGTVDGTSELAETIFSARGTKPIVAYSDGMIASAAYWIASAADEIMISGDTNPIGSIGVLSTHRDYSQAEERSGVKTTEITAGRYKRISSQYEPLTDAGREDIQAKVDYLYSAFVNSVARNRGVTADVVLSDMADGRIFIGKQAITAGLVDGVSTLPDVIARLQTTQNRQSIMKRRKTAAGAAVKQEKHIMTLEQLKADHPDLVEAITAEAQAGMVGQTALDAAVKDATEQVTARINGLVTATMGQAVGDKLTALVETGITPEQVAALGISIAPAVESSSVDTESRAAILKGVIEAAPDPLQVAKATETENRKSVVATIVAGAAKR